MILKIANRLCLSTALICTISGCAADGDSRWEEHSLFSSRYNFAGPATLVTSNDFEAFDDQSLTALVVSATPPSASKNCDSKVNCPQQDQNSPKQDQTPPKTIDGAIGAFYQKYYADVSSKNATFSDKASFRKDADTTFYVARNQIQDRLLAASEQRCNAYKKYLRHLDGSEGFIADALTSIFGGAGAIVTGAGAARLFSGLAGISSGIGAAAKQNIFSNLASSVIIPGIEQRRTDILQDIMDKRCHSAATYTVSLAITDALKFHAACTMDVGVETASKSIQATQNPSLDSLSVTLTKFQQVQKQVAAAAALAPNNTQQGQQTDTTKKSKTVKGTGSGKGAGTPAAAGTATGKGDGAGTNAGDGASTNGAAASTANNPATTSPTFEGVTLPVDCSEGSLAAWKAPSATTQTSTNKK